MSRFLKGLSSFVSGNASRSAPRDDKADTDAGPSTLTTPLFPLDGTEAPAASTPHRQRRNGADGQRDTSTEGAETVPPIDALVPLPAASALRKQSRKSSSSRALNAVVRATTQVALSTHVEPTPPPKVTRTSHRSTVVLTETEKLRLQIMQVQIKLTGLALYDGPIDAVMNHDLAESVRHFQTLKGLRETGMLTVGTLTALGIRPID